MNSQSRYVPATILEAHEDRIEFLNTLADQEFVLDRTVMSNSLRHAAVSYERLYAAYNEAMKQAYAARFRYETLMDSYGELCHTEAAGAVAAMDKIINKSHDKL